MTTPDALLTHFRKGDVAVWHGHEVEAVRNFDDPDRPVEIIARPGQPVPEGLTPQQPGWPPSRRVHPDELDAWYSSNWTFKWRGRRFSVTSIRSDGRIEAWLLDANDEWARENGLAVVEWGSAVGDFDLEELADLRETRIDLLARWRQEQGE